MFLLAILVLALVLAAAATFPLLARRLTDRGEQDLERDDEPGRSGGGPRS